MCTTVESQSQLPGENLAANGDIGSGNEEKTAQPHTSAAKKKSLSQKKEKSDVKAYQLSVHKALRSKLPLRANRCGIVPLQSDSEKPSYTIFKMYKMRKMGLSFKMIGKKMGIDPSREEVVSLYDVFQDNQDGLVNIESVTAPSKIAPPTPYGTCSILNLMF